MTTVLSIMLCRTQTIADQDRFAGTPQTQPTASRPVAGQPVPEDIEIDDLEDIELLELEVPVVVTAARREQKITDVPYAISVITQEDIRRAGARSVPEALRLVPGMDVAALHFGTNAVSPRGFHAMLANKTLVLVDGRQIFDCVFGGTVWAAWPFLLEDIERIEVIRGPGGVTWGANAVNGVINIITKDPKDQVGLTFIGGGGSRGWNKEYLGYAFSDEKLRFRISGQYEGSDGFLRGGSLFGKLEDDFKLGSMAIHGIYEATQRDTLLFSAASSVLDGGYTPNPLLDPRRSNCGGQTNYALGKWTHRVAADNTFELTAYVNDFHASFGLDSLDYRYQQFALQFSHTFKPSKTHTLSWGIDSRLDLIDGTNGDPPAMRTPYVTSGAIGVYLQDEWRFAERWQLNLGGRIDYDAYGGFEPSARAALSYRLNDNTAFYGAVSRAFQMSPAAGRHGDMELFGGLGWLHSPLDLDSQTLIAYELGYRGRYFDRLEVNLNLFWNEYADVITFSPRLGPPRLLRIEYDNNGSATVYGAELDAKYAATKQLTLLGNYTYQQLEWDSSAPFHETDTIGPPKHKFMLGARYSPTEDLHLSSHLYWVDAIRAPNPDFPLVSRGIDAYFRLDLLAACEFWDDRASISVGVRNLLDSHHYEGTSLFVNDAEVPRMIFAELRVTLK
ncbi:MAG: TonB-dependent receptor [Phycisphaerae bacterium]|nr:TonB-dependent receptor [Phycisphaerae bacterium]